MEGVKGSPGVENPPDDARSGERKGKGKRRRGGGRREERRGGLGGGRREEGDVAGREEEEVKGEKEGEKKERKTIQASPLSRLHRCLDEQKAGQRSLFERGGVEKREV